MNISSCIYWSLLPTISTHHKLIFSWLSSIILNWLIYHLQLRILHLLWVSIMFQSSKMLYLNRLTIASLFLTSLMLFNIIKQNFLCICNIATLFLFIELQAKQKQMHKQTSINKMSTTIILTFFCSSQNCNWSQSLLPSTKIWQHSSPEAQILIFSLNMHFCHQCLISNRMKLKHSF